jgi:hypothetical protein
MHRLGYRRSTAGKPCMNADPGLLQLVDVLTARREPGWLAMSATLLNGDTATQHRWPVSVSVLSRKPAQTDVHTASPCPAEHAWGQLLAGMDDACPQCRHRRRPRSSRGVHHRQEAPVAAGSVARPAVLQRQRCTGRDCVRQPSTRARHSPGPHGRGTRTQRHRSTADDASTYKATVAAINER